MSVSVDPLFLSEANQWADGVMVLFEVASLDLEACQSQDAQSSPPL